MADTPSINVASSIGHAVNVIRVRAEDSPNVRIALAREARGEMVEEVADFPGVLTWREYKHRRKHWSVQRQRVGLDGLFWEGKDILLFPSHHLDNCERLWFQLRAEGRQFRKAEAIGVDPAEGGDSTSMAAGDRYGLIELRSVKTPNTAVIKHDVVNFMNLHGVEPGRVCIDRGGGGKQIADDLREMGLDDVRTVAFGETVAVQPRRSRRFFKERRDVKEDHYAYMNRRAEMYHELSLLCNPLRDIDGDGRHLGWAMPPFTGVEMIDPVYAELRRQLEPLPLLYDKEGRIRMLSKNANRPDSEEMTLSKLLGCSPDEADAVALMVHALFHESAVAYAGAV